MVCREDDRRLGSAGRTRLAAVLPSGSCRSGCRPADGESSGRSTSYLPVAPVVLVLGCCLPGQAGSPCTPPPRTGRPRPPVSRRVPVAPALTGRSPASWFLPTSTTSTAAMLAIRVLGRCAWRVGPSALTTGCSPHQGPRRHQDRAGDRGQRADRALDLGARGRAVFPVPVTHAPPAVALLALGGGTWLVGALMAVDRLVVSAGLLVLLGGAGFVAVARCRRQPGG
jgi:hypothetical protein